MMLLKLSHSDTARINAARGTTAAKGTHWLSKDCYDFFPPLTIRNERGHKATYSCLVAMNYIDLGTVDARCRVTFEAENNLDFRLGTGPLRYSGLAGEGDLAAISRVGEGQTPLTNWKLPERDGEIMHSMDETTTDAAFERETTITLSDGDTLVRIWTSQHHVIQHLRKDKRFTETTDPFLLH